MLHHLRQYVPRLLLVCCLIAMGLAARRFDDRLPNDSRAVEPAAPAMSGAAKPKQAEPFWIAEGKLTNPVALAMAGDAHLIVLDHSEPPTLRRFSSDGQEAGTWALPPELSEKNPPDLLAGGEKGEIYVARSNAAGVWKINGEQSEKLATQVKPVAIAARGGVLYVLGNGNEGFERIGDKNNKSNNSRRIALAQTPHKGLWSQLRVGSKGELYAYAAEERVVWRMSPDGELLERIGGGGQAPPEVNLPADYINQHFDVADNGDLYWSLGDYGSLLKIDARAKTATHFRGRQAKGRNWTGNVGSLTGFAIEDAYGYVLDREFKRVTAIPTALAAEGAAHTSSIDTRAFGFNFKIESTAPYKVFTSSQVPLRVALDGGNRSIQQARLELQAQDFEGNIVATTSSTLEVKDDAPLTVDLPALQLPCLGWYQINCSLLASAASADSQKQKPLLTRTHFVTRTLADARLPIPEKESTGWDDLATHRMVGMGLHRYALHRADQIKEFEDDIRSARKLGVPYFVLIINREDCTPDKVRFVVEQLKSYGDEAPLLELVNEPDLKMSAGDYVKILRDCYDSVKSVSPDAQILGPVQCGIELRWFERFFRLGGGALIDAVSIHTYERHNSMDAAHWNWKFSRMREVLKKHGSASKPLYQTEHGFLGDYLGAVTRPHWQANQITLEKLVLDRFGIGDSEYFYYYVNEGGYRDFSAYIVNRERELLPAAAMTRIRRHLLGDKQFVRSLKFAPPSDWLLTGNLYRGAEGDLVILQNHGAFKPVEVQAKLPAGARVLDCWGNSLPVGKTLAVGRSPLYVKLPSPGAPFELSLSPFGRNIAAEAVISTTDAKGQSSVARLTNGQLEFDFHNQPERVGFLAADGKLPLDLVLEWNSPQTIHSTLLFASLADNDKSTPLEYELFARRGGGWKKVDEVNQQPQTYMQTLGNNAKLTNYENPWIFHHVLSQQKQALTTDALMFRFRRTTFGHYPTRDFRDQIGATFGQNLAPRVELREIQVLSPLLAP